MNSTVEGGLSFMQAGDASLAVRLAGAWRLRGGLPSASLLQRELDAAPQVKKVGFEAGELRSWDSSVLAFLVEVSELCRKRGIAMDRASLPAACGAVQLKQFGAQIYVADLVGIAMIREMGAMMTGIIMAGRTGAAFAAQLGTMKVTQEIDAFTTMGFSPLEFLVLPRVIALVLMMPLLCLYADFVGVLGGAAIGVGMLDLSWTTYLRETSNAIRLGDVFGGVFKASVYGVLIALAGCLRGMQCGNSSSAVGDAATSAVVTGIVAIVVACGVFAVVFYVLGI